MAETFTCNVIVFENEETIQYAVLPDGHRFVLLMRDQKPEVVGIDEPGEYEIDALDLGGARYPIALCVVDLAHVLAWSRVTIADVGRMIDRISAEVESRRAALAASEGRE